MSNERYKPRKREAKAIAKELAKPEKRESTDITNTLSDVEVIPSPLRGANNALTLLDLELQRMLNKYSGPHAPEMDLREVKRLKELMATMGITVDIKNKATLMESADLKGKKTEDLLKLLFEGK